MSTKGARRRGSHWASAVQRSAPRDTRNRRRRELRKWEVIPQCVGGREWTWSGQ